VVTLRLSVFKVGVCSALGGVLKGEARDGVGCLDGVEDAKVFDD